MKIRLHNNDDTDHVDYEADTLEEIMKLCADRIYSKGWTDGWSEELDN